VRYIFPGNPKKAIFPGFVEIQRRSRGDRKKRILGGSKNLDHDSKSFLAFKV